MFPSGYRRAFLLTELMIALTVLGILMAAMAATLFGVRRFHQVLWFRQQCTAAAQAQIDSLTATGHIIEPDRIASMWPGMKIETQVRPGQGQWQGLDLIQATASIPTGKRTVTIRLARYGKITKTVASDSEL